MASPLLSSLSLLNNAHYVNRLLFNFNQIVPGGVSCLGAAAINLCQTREMSKVKTRHTHPYFWWSKKRRERNDQELTSENEAFLNKVIYDQYGPLQTAETGAPYISPLKEVVHERGEWKERSIRTGVIARKLGVYPMWTTQGRRILTTLLQVVDNHVIKYIPPEVVQQNYGSQFKRKDVGLLLVGSDSSDPQRFNKEYLGLFEGAGLPPKNKISRFMVTDNAKLQPGTPLYATHFMVGQKVEIFGKTIDRGFQGVMKRWGFKGMPATHGVTKSHRRGGCIGGGGEKGRVWPGTKMPGHMGNHWRKLFAQTIVRINTKYNVIFVKGTSVMGNTGAYVSIHDTFTRDRFDHSVLPFPTHYPDECEEPIPEEYYDEGIFDFGSPSLAFEDRV